MIISQSNHYESSTLSSSSYDVKQQQLFVTFKSNITYLYKNVSEEVYKQFSEAESHGSALNKFIKNNKDIECLKISVEKIA
tara:strand:- start:32 stop:274 length:243 start_codon:yes stop_codon:yes gene_type:complete